MGNEVKLKALSRTETCYFGKQPFSGLNVKILEQPEVARPIDITSIAVYDLAKDPTNYLEVTHFDAEKRQLRGRFHIKVVQAGVNRHIPIPLSDTLVLSNGEFSVGFSRKTS